MFKTLTAAAAIIAASATLASADFSNISDFVEEQDRGNIVELGTVTASGAGTLEVYSFHKGVQGNLLGVEEIHAGANSDVRVQIPRTFVDAIAVLSVNGVVVDTQELEFN